MVEAGIQLLLFITGGVLVCAFEEESYRYLVPGNGTEFLRRYVLTYYTSNYLRSDSTVGYCTTGTGTGTVPGRLL
jgi:hypothetical protein